MTDNTQQARAAVTPEAIEAAAKALREAFDLGVGGFEEQARAALEAGARHILAGAARETNEDRRMSQELAWEKGYYACYEGQQRFRNPYRVTRG